MKKISLLFILIISTFLIGCGNETKSSNNKLSNVTINERVIEETMITETFIN